MVVNLTDKIDYVRAEICKFNPCLCIISLTTGIIFFSYRVFEGVGQNRKHCNSNLFNTASDYTSLLKPKICMRWISDYYLVPLNKSVKGQTLTRSPLLCL